MTMNLICKVQTTLMSKNEDYEFQFDSAHGSLGLKWWLRIAIHLCTRPSWAKMTIMNIIMNFALQVLRIVSRLTCILSCISLVYYFFYTWGTCIEISRDLHWNLRLFSKTLATCHSQLLQNVAEARNRTRACWMRGKCAYHSAMRNWYK